jgi:LPS-assembly protein
MRRVIVAIALLACFRAFPADAQQSGEALSGGGNAVSVQREPLHLQSDEIVYDDKANRIIARGSVELYFMSHILTADELVFDGERNTLVASGNAKLTAPDGTVTRAERLEAGDELRDAFVASLTPVEAAGEATR